MSTDHTDATANRSAPPIIDRSRLRALIALDQQIAEEQEFDRGRAAEILERLDHKPEDFPEDLVYPQEPEGKDD